MSTTLHMQCPLPHSKFSHLPEFNLPLLQLVLNIPVLYPRLEPDIAGVTTTKGYSETTRTPTVLCLHRWSYQTMKNSRKFPLGGITPVSKQFLAQLGVSAAVGLVNLAQAQHSAARPTGLHLFLQEFNSPKSAQPSELPAA